MIDFTLQEELEGCELDANCSSCNTHTHECEECVRGHFINGTDSTQPCVGESAFRKQYNFYQNFIMFIDLLCHFVLSYDIIDTSHITVISEVR